MTATEGRFLPADEDLDLPEPLGEHPELPRCGRVVYIAGPMSSLPEFNFPAFHAKAAELRGQGIEVRNPADNGGSTDKPWEYYMRLGLRQLLQCDEIHLLPGWRDSRGAKIELFVAEALGMTVSGADA